MGRSFTSQNTSIAEKQVKHHPEISARGIEYGFGKSKKNVHRNNDCKAANLNINVLASISTV